MKLTSNLALPLRSVSAVLVSLCFLSFSNASQAEGSSVEKASSLLEQNMNTLDDMNQAGKSSQAKIDRIHEQTQALLQQYRQSKQNLERYEENIKYLEEVAANQVTKKIDLSAQIDAVSETETSIVPLLTRMIDALALSIDNDMPFLIEERRNRIQGLKDMMSQSDIGLPEKYRRVVEAYEIEREFGYTLETYRSEISLVGTPVRVQVLRVGRIGLYYQTEDKLKQGLWNPRAQEWQEFQSFSEAVDVGIAMAEEKRSPELLDLPFFLSATTSAQGVAE